MILIAMTLLFINVSTNGELATLWIALGFILACLMVIVHVACAIGIMADCSNLERQGRHAVLVSSPIWALAALLAGIFVLAAYWMVHHSSLNPEVGKPVRENPALPRTAASVREARETDIRNQPAEEFVLDDLLERNRPDPPKEG